MKSDHPSRAHRMVTARSVTCSIWTVVAFCLLLVAFSEDAVAASGSTRLTIRIDQGVVDAIARWKGEKAQPLANPASGEADRVLQRLLPVAQAGLEMTHHPLSVSRILQRLRQDALIVLEGRAEHAGQTGNACVLDKAAGGLLTVHSI